MSKKKEEIKIEDINETPNDEVSEEVTKKIKDYKGDLRGFKTLEEAVNYPNTDEFKRLDIGCRTEYSNWLKNILEEE